MQPLRIEDHRHKFAMERRGGSWTRLVGGVGAIILSIVLGLHLLGRQPPTSLNGPDWWATERLKFCPESAVHIAPRHTAPSEGEWGEADEEAWLRFKWLYQHRRFRDPPAVLKRLFWLGKSGAATCPDFASHPLFDRIEWDLKPWRQLRAREGRTALEAAAARAGGMADTPEYYSFTTGRFAEEGVSGCVRNAPQHWPYWSNDPGIASFLGDLAPLLPAGITFSFEWGDGARAWNSLGLGAADTFERMPNGFMSFAHQRQAGTGARFDMELDPPAAELGKFLHRTCLLDADQIDNHVLRHAAMHRPRMRDTGIRSPVAMFSQNKVDGCMVDILFPTPYWLGISGVAGSDRAWEERRPSPTVWRGTTTGTDLASGVEEGYDWKKGHRIRLTTQFAGSEVVDAKIVGVLQCGEGRPESNCDEVEEYLRGRGAMGERLPGDYVTSFRHLLDVDGNGWSSRLPKLLWARSLVLRAGVFSSFIDGLLQPWEHYVPVRLDFADLEDRVLWAMEHEAEVRRIVANVQRDFPSATEMYDWMLCYAHFLLLEYGCLFFDLCE